VMRRFLDPRGNGRCVRQEPRGSIGSGSEHLRLRCGVCRLAAFPPGALAVAHLLAQLEPHEAGSPSSRIRTGGWEKRRACFTCNPNLAGYFINHQDGLSSHRK
jgi:hypothetical protein